MPDTADIPPPSTFCTRAARLADPSFFTHPDFHPTLAWLRENSPVHWVQAWPDRGFWAVTTYGLIKTVYLDPGTYSSERSGSLMPIDPAIMEGIDPGSYGIGLVPAFTDPPRHDDVRRQIGKYFNARVARASSDCTEICQNLISAVLDRGECDLVHDLAAPVPSHVICHLMGIPACDWDHIKALVDQFLVGAGGDPTNLEPAARASAQNAMQHSREALVSYVTEMVGARRANPQEDLTSYIIQLRVNGVELSDEEIIWNIWSLIMGGFETSRNVISGGLVALVENRDQLDLLAREPERLNVAVDELVRWTSPGQVSLRTATRDVELGGKRISQGDWLTVWPISANRDAAVFERPYSLDISRYPNPHLGFGFGVHNCIGRPLALMESRAMIAEILRSMTDIQIVSDLVWSGSTIAMGLQSGRISFKAR